MLPRVYVETSVISYLVARRNQRDLLVAANQELTHERWETRRQKFDLYTSVVVLAEAARGDQSMAAARVAIARELTLVECHGFGAGPGPGTTSECGHAGERQ